MFAGMLFYFEGHYVQAYVTLGLVFMPGFCIFVSELKRTFCSKPCSLVKAIGYLLFSPLWAIVIHFYRYLRNATNPYTFTKYTKCIPFFSLCDERYVKSALFFKTLQGFVEAGPQFALQLSLLFQGRWGESSKAVLEPIIPSVTLAPFQLDNSDLVTTTIDPFQLDSAEELNSTTSAGLMIFDRVYDEGN